ncbi:MAG: hydrogenase maturation protease [Saprospiraceae bacterium]|jgi:hydrogenase maturation protease|nr:hydrogenase maturation protease [Saprospiraceae bacterium]
MKELKTETYPFLIIGIGNTGRGDDGLGWQFISWIKKLFEIQVDYEYRYQLQIEDSELVSRYNQVLFVDASHSDLKNGYELKQCNPVNHYFFSSHAQSPETILYLTECLYGVKPKAFSLAISGYCWELKTIISTPAKKNLDAAIQYFTEEYIPKISRQQIFKI